MFHHTLYDMEWSIICVYITNTEITQNSIVIFDDRLHPRENGTHVLVEHGLQYTIRRVTRCQSYRTATNTIIPRLSKLVNRSMYSAKYI